MSIVETLENEIKGLENRKLELLKQLELAKLTQETEIPFKTGDKYFVIEGSGRVTTLYWTKESYYSDTFLQGNAFHSEKEAKRECKRRILLTRLKQFRDKCNGDWKPESEKAKYYIFLEYENLRLCVSSSMFFDAFNMFGYFKNCDDAERAIELFGDEIKRLFVEVKNDNSL